MLSMIIIHVEVVCERVSHACCCPAARLKSHFGNVSFWDFKEVRLFTSLTLGLNEWESTVQKWLDGVLL